MKRIIAVTLIAYSSFLLSCKNTPVPIEEGFTSILADSTMNIQVTATNNQTYYEFGFKFQVLKDGKIAKLGTKLPNAGSYRVSIWDAESKTVLLEKVVNQTQANKQHWVNISLLPIIKDKEYLISVLANNWNDAFQKTGKAIEYPIEKGNIKLLQFAYTSQPSSSSPPKFPNMTDNYYSISGFVDFGFISN